MQLGSQNADLVPLRDLHFRFDVTRLSYFSVSLQYTLSFADGTGSYNEFESDSRIRNLDNLPPKVLAPLSFDQRHTAIAVIDFLYS